LIVRFLIARCFFSSAVAFFLQSSQAAPPGGNLVEGISDECDTLSPIWHSGLRGWPDALSVQDGLLSIRSCNGDNGDYPSARDMVSTYADQIGRALDLSEGPSVMTSVWLPLFSCWPTGENASGYREWLGFRVTAYDVSLSVDSGLYCPGIYIGNDDDGQCLIARVGDGYSDDVTIGRITAPGWWTLGMSWDAQGRTQYYAAPGEVTLTDADLLYSPPISVDPAANRSLTQLIGNFWALRMTYPPTGDLSPDWRADFYRVFVGTQPALPLIALCVSGGIAQVEITGCSRGFRYLLEASDDLINWTTVDDAISDGSVQTFQEPTSNRRFYRVARP